MVRGKKVTDALALLKFMPKKGADILYKVIHSAASNAKNNFKQSIDDLYITQILVTKGATFKRSLPISRGRVHPIRKRTSHITVEVGLLEGQEPKVSAKDIPLDEKGRKGKAKKDDTEPKKTVVKKTSKKEDKETPAKAGQDK